VTGEAKTEDREFICVPAHVPPPNKASLRAVVDITEEKHDPANF